MREIGWFATPEHALSPRCQARETTIAQHLCGLAAVGTASAFAIPVTELLARTRRTPYIAFARQSAMYVSHVAFGLSCREVGRAFGRSHSTTAHAWQLVEERRDDPAVDALLSSLESACGSLKGQLSGGRR